MHNKGLLASGKVLDGVGVGCRLTTSICVAPFGSWLIVLAECWTQILDARNLFFTWSVFVWTLCNTGFPIFFNAASLAVVLPATHVEQRMGTILVGLRGSNVTLVCGELGGS